jgi:hypothetical protein
MRDAVLKAAVRGEEEEPFAVGIETACRIDVAQPDVGFQGAPLVTAGEVARDAIRLLQEVERAHRETKKSPRGARASGGRRRITPRARYAAGRA